MEPNVWNYAPNTRDAGALPSRSWEVALGRPRAYPANPLLGVVWSAEAAVSFGGCDSMETGRRKTVMVVDDSDIVLEVVRTTLEAAGYRVLVQNSPAGCVALMLKEEPDLVLVDVSMPEVGGDTLVRCFGTAHPTSTSIVLLHSSLPEEALKAKVKASGAHGYIRKMNNQTAFVREVAYWLRHATLRAVAEGRSSSGAYESQPRPVASEERFAMTSGARPAAPATVLLVDSDMLELSAYRRQLNSDDMSFEFALSGAHALGRIAGSNPPSVVVSNVVIGDVSGIEVYSRAVVMNRKWADRFVFFTNRGDDDVVAAFGATFTGPMLFQPFHIDDLKRAIRSCLWRNPGGHTAIAG